MSPEIFVLFTSGGLESVSIGAASEGEEKAGAKLLEPIQACLDEANTILKKISAGPRE
jgi:hypothetical protein